MPPRRILVLRFGAYGDVLLTAPAVAALRAALPDARLGFGVRAELADAARPHPAVDELVEVAPGEGVWSYARKVRAFRPDVVLDLHGKLRSRVLRLLLWGVPFVVWRQRPWLETLRVRLLGRRPRPLAALPLRFHEAVERLVGRSLPPEPFAAPAAPGAASDATLHAAGLPVDRPILALSPGANWATKRWPVAAYAAVARSALAEGWAVAVLGSAGEAALGAELVAAAPGAVDLTGAVPLAALPAFLRRCTAYVGNDSGPTHLARGLGVRTVAVFTSTDPDAVGVPATIALRADLPCAPCSFHGRETCPKGHFRCLAAIAPAAVWARARGG